MELPVINHPKLGAIMDPIVNLNKPKQPNSPDEDQNYIKTPIKSPSVVGKLPPMPTPLMGAIRIRMPGGPEVLEYKLVTTPKPENKEVLIKVIASSINKYDIMLRKGLCLPAPGDNIYPGLDCAGIIEAIGPGVTKWKVGDEVSIYMFCCFVDIDPLTLRTDTLFTPASKEDRSFYLSFVVLIVI